MRFNVSQLLKEGVGARRSYSLDETFEAMPETGTSRIKGEITITRIDIGVWLNGDIEANAASLCGRCLTPAEYTVRFRLDEEYLPTVEIGACVQPRSPETVKEGTFTLDSSHTLDLTEAVWQYAIINLPMKPLCRQTCAGLCSTCGANLNDSPCDCSKSADARWSPLLNLLAAKANR
jgi:uncharacterized protein